MRTRLWLPLLILVMAVAACSGGGSDTVESTQISGRIEYGLRVLTVDPSARDQHFRIYRGDYVRLERTDGQGFSLEIPALEVAMAFPVPEGERPYFKVPTTGSYPFTMGEAGGIIEAVEYAAAAYREVTAKEAAGLIANLDPVIVDVRTDREFAEGHIDGAVLIPVQVLQSRVGELADYKEDPVFIYCRSGNRSTVAAKVLIDAGHKQIINLRRGVKDWAQAGLPLVK